MDNTATTNEVQVTSNYRLFRLMHDNREQSPSHILRLKAAFEEFGNLTAAQPVLVNENMEVVDGQHRLTAARELGVPVYYRVVPGLNIRTARSMNILHRSWNVDDYAESYAASGDANYQRYLRLREDFQYNHSIILTYIAGSRVDSSGDYKAFREGNFTLSPDQDTRARERLAMLNSVEDIAPMAHQREFALAFLTATQVPGYDHQRMVNKMTSGSGLIHRYASVADYQRMLEEIYNFKMPENNRLRLF